VAFCDDDTWWSPGSLAGAVDVLSRHPRLAVITASITVEPGGYLDPICEEMRRSPLPCPPNVPGMPLLSFLAGASVIRRRAFVAVGGFSPRLLIGGEEELLAADLAEAGWAMAYLPDLEIHHHASGLRDPHLRRRQGIRNTLWFAWLRRSPLGATRRTGAMLASIPRDRHSLAAVLEAVRGVTWVAGERRAVNADVESGLRLLDADLRRSQARQYVS
jgi:GT2 family glycosyltransferase